ncbi:MAG: CarD family transcriptional regulator [Alphaproteobacteria bacterium]
MGHGTLEARQDRPAAIDGAPFHTDLTPGLQVMHPKHGIGRVKGIEEREVQGRTQRYVIVDFIRLALVVGIPQSALTHSGLRRPNDADEMQAVLAVLGGEPEAAQSHWSRRAGEQETKLNSGRPELLAEVLRDLAPRRGRGRDGVIFREALARLAEELAVADDVAVEAATAKIEALLPQALPKGRAGQG